jgi:NDP-mannose synthase
MKAVVLAGGRGTRLLPYTTVFPKPLMPIGDKPILDVVIRQLRRHGFTEITLAVGHLAELLMAYFGDGERFGVTIRYSREEQPLGTAGPLALVEGLTESFLVMNGDILTALDYGAMFEAHRRGGQIATLAVFPRSVKSDFGVVEFDAAGALTQYLEKPTHDYWVSMGVYVFDPRVREHIAPNERLDLPDLLQRLRSRGESVRCHVYQDYWLDIGRVEDYQQAVVDFERLRDRFLPPE